MKNKVIFLFIFAAVILLSFTFSNGHSKKQVEQHKNTAKAGSSGGLVMEDRNQWD